MHLIDYLTSTVVFHRTRVYQMQPRNGQNWHSCSPEIGHFRFVSETIGVKPIILTIRTEKNSLIKGEELHIRYRSRTNETETKTTFCTSIKLEFVSGCVKINSNFRQAQIPLSVSVSFVRELLRMLVEGCI